MKTALAYLAKIVVKVGLKTVYNKIKILNAETGWKIEVMEIVDSFWYLGENTTG